jgi:hypothetical protein
MGASMASYDEMNPTDRRNLFEGLASLSGFEEGPKRALPMARATSTTPFSRER